MANYHFQIKHDKQSGTRTSAVNHVAYINREGIYKDIDQQFANNTLSVSLENQLENQTKEYGQTYPILYQNKNGIIIEKNSSIETSVNTSVETLHVALVLAMKKYGNELNVQGSNEYKAQVITAAVELNLPVSFSDISMEKMKIKLQEEKENETRTITRISLRTGTGIEEYRQPNIKRVGQDAPPQRRGNLHTMSELHVVQNQEDRKGLLSGDVRSDMATDREGRFNNIVRRDFSRARRVSAEKIVDNILFKKQTDAVGHTEYINREAAFASRGDCVHKDHHLPTWANDNPKTFWEKADIYEDQKNTRYREIEFHLPNELTLDQSKEVINEFVDNHLGKDFYWSYAIHDKEAKFGTNGERNTHVHIMFSERKIDQHEKENERSPEIFFKKGNWKTATVNKGCPKDPKWNGAERFAYLHEMRKDCAMIQNRVLEKYGFDIAVDHRSIVAQRESALERGDDLLAKLLDRPAEKNIGYTVAMTENHPKVEELKISRLVRRDLQQLIVASHILQRSILKEDTNKSVDQTMAQANLSLSEIKTNPEIQKLQSLSNFIIETSKEMAVVRKLIIWDAEALAMARREYMTPSEIALEKESKIINEDVLTIKRLEKELIKPADWNTAALKTYTDTKKQIANHLATLTTKSKDIGTKLREINAKFFTKDYKIKVYKAQQQILEENKPAKENLKILQIKLDKAVEETKSIIAKHREEKVKAVEKITKPITIKTIADLEKPNTELANIKSERTKLESDQKAFEQKPIPTPYSFERVAWTKEQIALQDKTKALDHREKSTIEEISTIKNSIKSQETSAPIAQQQPIHSTTKETTIEFTAREAQEILSAEIKSLQSEYNMTKRESDALLKEIISEPRALEMAKARFLGADLKAVKEEKAKIAKETTNIENAKLEYNKAKKEFDQLKKPHVFQSSTNYNEQKFNVESMYEKIKDRESKLALLKTKNETTFHNLDKKATTPEAIIKIEAIKNSILKENKPKSDLYNKIQGELKTINIKLTSLKEQEKYLGKLSKQDLGKKAKTKHEHVYKVKQTAPLSTSQNNLITSAASNLANSFLNPKAVSLRANIYRDDQEEEFKDLLAQGVDLDFN